MIYKVNDNLFMRQYLFRKIKCFIAVTQSGVISIGFINGKYIHKFNILLPVFHNPMFHNPDFTKI